MSGLIAGLSGAGGAANATGGYYNSAMQNLINATGSPAAQTFGRLQLAAERPAFQSSNDALAAQQAAMGLGGSGEGRALGGSVASNEAATSAGALAPLYSEALQGYSNIDAAMPGAQSAAYNQAIQDFYSALGSGAQGAGMFFGLKGLKPPGGGGGGGDGTQYGDGTVVSTQDPGTGYYGP